MDKIVDLSLTIEKGMRGVDHEVARRVETDGWNALTLHLYTHAGTHMDAPKHFGVSEQSIDEIALERCMGMAWVVDLWDCEPGLDITIDHLGHIAQAFTPGECLRIKTGWSRFVHQPIYREKMPRISQELANWCVDNQVKLLGVESPSVADVNPLDELTDIHHILFKGDVVIVEGLTNLDKLTKPKVKFMAFPIKLSGADGMPVRAVALE